MGTAHFSILFLLALELSAPALEHPWQQISNPTAAEAAEAFANPPPEYSAQFTWGWHGPVDRESIARDLDGMKALHVQAAIIEPGTGMRHPYLSPEYFQLVRIAVEEARKRNMRLWFMDEGQYPSGLAGGKFTLERPELCMKALGDPERVSLSAGTPFSRILGSNVICAVAVDRASGAAQVLQPKAGRVDWIAPVGDWEIVLVQSVFRSGPTRSANTPTAAKDYTHSLMDYLDPVATQLFKEWTFEGYRKAIGDEFGKTVLGFRGDEPAYNFNPWTPNLLHEFQQRKGYDLRPYLVAFGTGPAWRNPALTVEQRRAYADYCDVWSDLFRDHFFNLEGDWCAGHGLEMQLHIEHEELLPQLAIADGDFFKCFRRIQVPGVDIIWHQVWMDNPADFPKLASSAAHLYGHPRAMCEAFAAYRPPPNLEQARWLLDFLLARGINRIEYMFWPSSSRGARGRLAGSGATNTAGTQLTDLAAITNAAGSAVGGGTTNRYYRDPGFPAVATYVNRLSYLLGEGIPGAQIGLFIPSSSFWLADGRTSQEINQSLLSLAHQLLACQRDFDFIDEQALSSPVLTLRKNELLNLSGQAYRAIIVPPSLAISRAALERLRAFAAAGGTVIFIGAAPELVVDKTFLHATGPADISFATLHEKQTAVTPALLNQLPTPELAFARPSPLVSYTHRRIRDADVYFLFNSGDEQATLDATLAGSDSVQIWDPRTGSIVPATSSSPAGGNVSLHLELQPWSTRVMVVGGNAQLRGDTAGRRVDGVMPP